MGNFDRAVLGGNHVEGKPGLVSLPTIYHWKEIKPNGAYLGLQLSNKNGYVGQFYVKGGIHLMATSFLPEALLKELSMGGTLIIGPIRNLPNRQLVTGGFFSFFSPLLFFFPP